MDHIKEFIQSELIEKQSWPLEQKIEYTKILIQEWYDHWEGKVYLSFSGGKDSTVLKHIIKSMKLDIPVVFVNTTNEWPEIISFVNSLGSSITKLKPLKTFREIITQYGYPVISKEQSQYIEEYRHTKSDKLKNKRKYGTNGSFKISKKWFFLTKADFEVTSLCCNYLKKEPFKRYEKETKRKAIVGTMTHESELRKSSWLKYGCNSFNTTRPVSKPLSIWLEKDIWEYIQKYNIEISKVYDFMDRSGCMGCAFGLHLEKGENRFQMMERTHPKKWNFIINVLGYGKVLDYIGIPYRQKQITKPIF